MLPCGVTKYSGKPEEQTSKLVDGEDVKMDGEDGTIQNKVPSTITIQLSENRKKTKSCM